MSDQETPDHFREFRCLSCGNCCRGEGYVNVSPEEMARIANYLGITVDDFIQRYTRDPEFTDSPDSQDRWLIDQPVPLKDCIFLENNRCVVHAVKPDQCVGFPTKWRTPDAFDYCEGLRAE